MARPGGWAGSISGSSRGHPCAGPGREHQETAAAEAVVAEIAAGSCAEWRQAQGGPVVTKVAAASGHGWRHSEDHDSGRAAAASMGKKGEQFPPAHHS